jgi:hypothetical protein
MLKINPLVFRLLLAKLQPVWLITVAVADIRLDMSLSAHALASWVQMPPAA